MSSLNHVCEEETMRLNLNQVDNDPQASRTLIDINELSRRLSITKGTLYNWVYLRRIPFIKHPTGLSRIARPARSVPTGFPKLEQGRGFE